MNAAVVTATVDDCNPEAEAVIWVEPGVGVDLKVAVAYPDPARISNVEFITTPTVGVEDER